PRDSTSGVTTPSGTSTARNTGPLRSSRSVLPTSLPVFSRFLQLPISLGMDLLLTRGEHVFRSYVADGAIQADIVVMLDVALHQTPCIIQRQRRSRPNTLSPLRFVPTLDFSVRLGIVR